MKGKLLAVSLCAAVGISQQANAVPIDVAFIVDQSYSMRNEFNWIPNVMTEIDTALATMDQVDSSRYGVVGYMENPQTRNNGTELVYQDLTSDISTVSTATDGARLYGTRESGYEAAYWSQTGFSWADDAVKIMILLTDERADQYSDIGDVPSGMSREEYLGQSLDDNGFLLNVITHTGYYNQWDDAVFDIDSDYTGLFNIAQLRDDVEGFTASFVDAKIAEIEDVIDDDPGPSTSVPEPATLALLGLGMLGVSFSRRKKS